jgi:hypothetical protein
MEGFFTCTACRGRIGSYEPMWWRRADGTLSASSVLRLRADPALGEAGAAYFHDACLPLGADEAVVEGVAHQLRP